MTSHPACPPMDWRGFPYAIGYFLRDYIRLGRRTRRRAAHARFQDLMQNQRTSLVAIDCGANVGKVSERLLDAGYVVHAFEPEPMALAELKNRLDGRQNFILHEKAVGTAPGTATLFRHRDVMNNKKRTEASSLINQPQCDDRNTVVVEVESLPDFIAALGGRVGILKMDIEGYEVAILNAILDRGQHRDIDFVLAETHERFSLPLAWQTAKLRARIRQNAIANIDLDHI